jgi:hypothetical protein
VDKQVWMISLYFLHPFYSVTYIIFHRLLTEWPPFNFVGPTDFGPNVGKCKLTNHVRRHMNAIIDFFLVNHDNRVKNGTILCRRNFGVSTMLARSIQNSRNSTPSMAGDKHLSLSAENVLREFETKSFSSSSSHHTCC